MTDLFVRGEASEAMARCANTPGSASPPTAVAPRLRNSRRVEPRLRAWSCGAPERLDMAASPLSFGRVPLPQKSNPALGQPQAANGLCAAAERHEGRSLQAELNGVIFCRPAAHSS